MLPSSLIHKRLEQWLCDFSIISTMTKTRSDKVRRHLLEKNKLAAQRCRAKRKEDLHHLLIQVNSLHEENQLLQEKHDSLEDILFNILLFQPNARVLYKDVFGKLLEIDRFRKLYDGIQCSLLTTIDPSLLHSTIDA